MDVGGTGEFTAEMLCAFMKMTDSELEIIDEKERREEKERADEIARQVRHANAAACVIVTDGDRPTESGEERGGFAGRDQEPDA